MMILAESHQISNFSDLDVMAVSCPCIKFRPYEIGIVSFDGYDLRSVAEK